MNLDRVGSFDVRFIEDLRGNLRMEYCAAQKEHLHRADFRIHPVGRLAWSACAHHLSVVGQKIPKGDVFLILNPNDPR